MSGTVGNSEMVVENLSSTVDYEDYYDENMPPHYWGGEDVSELCSYDDADKI